MGPLYDKDGHLLRYGGPNLKRMISVDEYNSSNLNVCAMQVAYLESVKRRATQ